MMILRVQAAFAAYRAFVAGSFRNTAPFITPSGAYGLLLNIAGVESRYDDGQSVMTLTRADLPVAYVALGVLAEPQTCQVYQQLHNYPVTTKDKDAGLERAKGAKYNIQPVRREVLVGIDGYIGLKGNDALEEQIRDALGNGLAAPRPDGRPRYGVPFLGDNSYLIDRLDLLEPGRLIEPARWYCRLRDLPGEPTRVQAGTCRMTIWIDRSDSSRSVTALYAPDPIRKTEIPAAAWTRVSPSEEVADGYAQRSPS
ncbi:MAG TPA: CRISPR-associated protein Cas5 [Phycisphaerae bacterium]|nr:CRISPR-associated protein Cas5 [Phycisphaerae bacterium]